MNYRYLKAAEKFLAGDPMQHSPAGLATWLEAQIENDRRIQSRVAWEMENQLEYP